MKIRTIVLTSLLSVASLGITPAAKADTANARCDVYPKGEDRIVFTGSCNFSQRQGAISIQLENGQRYQLTPVGNRPGNYRDQNGQRAFRESGGSGNSRQIYRLANESVFVYFTSSNSNQSSNSSASRPSSSPTPATTIVRRTRNQITVRITEGEFNFSGVLNRTSGNTFVGSDGRVRVTYNRNNGQIRIVNAATGTVFYNYVFSDVDEGRL